MQAAAAGQPQLHALCGPPGCLNLLRSRPAARGTKLEKSLSFLVRVRPPLAAQFLTMGSSLSQKEHPNYLLLSQPCFARSLVRGRINALVRERAGPCGWHWSAASEHQRGRVSTFAPVRAVQLKMRRDPFGIEIPGVVVAEAVEARAHEVTQVHKLKNVFR